MHTEYYYGGILKNNREYHLTSLHDQFGTMYTLLIKPHAGMFYFTPCEYRKVSPQKVTALLKAIGLRIADFKGEA